eukprot:gene12408-biopygen3434
MAPADTPPLTVALITAHLSVYMMIQMQEYLSFWQQCSTHGDRWVERQCKFQARVPHASGTRLDSITACAMSVSVGVSPCPQGRRPARPAAAPCAVRTTS